MKTTTAPTTVTANFVWDFDADCEGIRLPSRTPNTGRFNEEYEDECGCRIATYSLDICGGPADLLLHGCDDFGGPFCTGWRVARANDGKFKVVVR